MNYQLFQSIMVEILVRPVSNADSSEFLIMTTFWLNSCKDWDFVFEPINGGALKCFICNSATGRLTYHMYHTRIVGPALTCIPRFCTSTDIIKKLVCVNITVISVYGCIKGWYWHANCCGLSWGQKFTYMINVYYKIIYTYVYVNIKSD